MTRCQGVNEGRQGEHLDFEASLDAPLTGDMLYIRVATEEAEESSGGVNEARSTKRYSLADVRPAKITRHVTRENKEALVSSFVRLSSLLASTGLRSFHFASLPIFPLSPISSSHSICVFWYRVGD